MSLILDALKKSEQSRKRSSLPGIADVKSATPATKSPRWLWPLAGLLAVNAVVLLWVLLRPDTAQSDTDRAPAPEPEAAAGLSGEDLPPLPRRTEVRSLSREVAAATPVANDPPPAAEPATVPAAAEPAPATAPAAAVATAAPDLPLYSELRSSGRLNLPELHVDLHVYHADPARRLAYINGAKLNEGETASEGFRVVAIRADGVVLNQGGTEFLLPRD